MVLVVDDEFKAVELSVVAAIESSVVVSPDVEFQTVVTFPTEVGVTDSVVFRLAIGVEVTE